MAFKKAEKPRKSPKVAITGPSGSGKTHTALEIALAWSDGKRVAVIDTESKRALLFAKKFDFDHADMAEEYGNYDPDNYIKMIKEAQSAKDEDGSPAYGAIIIDSLTHAWSGVGGILQKVSAIPGNSYTDGWGKVGTPLQRKLMNAVITCPVPTICTMRVKTDTVLETNAKGKLVPVTKGMKADQRDDVVYEFDFVLALDMDHTMTIQKCPPIDGMIGTVIQPNNISLFAAQILSWMTDGQDVPAPTPTPAPVSVPPQVFVPVPKPDPAAFKKEWAEYGAELKAMGNPEIVVEGRKLFGQNVPVSQARAILAQMLEALSDPVYSGNGVAEPG